MSNIDSLIADVMKLLSNAKITFSQRCVTNLQKNVFGSRTIISKSLSSCHLAASLPLAKKAIILSVLFNNI